MSSTSITNGPATTAGTAIPSRIGDGGPDDEIDLFGAFRLSWPGRAPEPEAPLTPRPPVGPVSAALESLGRRRGRLGRLARLANRLRRGEECRGWPVALSAPGPERADDPFLPRVRVTGQPFG